MEEVAVKQEQIGNAVKDVDVAHAEAQVIINHLQHSPGKDKMKFYSGEECATLQMSPLKRVRELQYTNDDLQRQAVSLKQQTNVSEDPLKILAEIDYCNAMISKNTGEVLSLHTQNKRRLERAAQLQVENMQLEQALTDTQAAFAVAIEGDRKAGYASDYFTAKVTLEKNKVELEQLMTP